MSNVYLKSKYIKPLVHTYIIIYIYTHLTSMTMAQNMMYIIYIYIYYIYIQYTSNYIYIHTIYIIQSL